MGQPSEITPTNWELLADFGEVMLEILSLELTLIGLVQAQAEDLRGSTDYGSVDRAEASRCLDAMEEVTGLRGEPNSEGRLYVVEGEDVGKLADSRPAPSERLAGHLPFEV